MKTDRESNAKKNIFITLLSQLLTIVCGLIVPRCMLQAYGSEANGAVTSIATFLGYIALLEGGVGGVARAALYQPLAENDIYKISAVMAEIKRFFRHVGYFFFVYVLVIACIFKQISHTDAFDWITSFILVIIISLSTFAQYFIGISNVVLIYAAQRQYINNLLNVGCTVTNMILVVVLVNLGCNLFTVKLFSSVIFIAKPIVLWYIVNKQFTFVSVKKDASLLKDKWTGLGQHIAYFLHTHTDVVVLTIFGNLKAVSVYGIYNMVTNAILNVTTSFYAGSEALFGDMYAKKETDRLNNAFGMYETLVSIVAVVLFGSTMALLIPFISLYTKGITDANYIQPVFGLMLTIACLIYCLRAPYHNMIIAAGQFKETKAAAYGESIINILSSVLLVIQFGLVGVAIGTVAATFYRFVYYAVYLSKHVMQRNIGLFLKRLSINAITIVFVQTIGRFILTFFTVTSYLQWIVAGFVIAAVTGIITIMINMLFYKNDCYALLNQVKQRRHA